MVQLVICDVDGTLVEDGGSASALNPEYYDIIEKLTRQGIQMVICSGRQKASVEKLFALSGSGWRKSDFSERGVYLFTGFGK